MTERKCINEFVVRESAGRATCPSPRFDSILENGCTGCPKLTNFNKPRADPRTTAEKAADLALIKIRADGVREKARETGIYWKI